MALDQRLRVGRLHRRQLQPCHVIRQGRLKTTRRFVIRQILILPAGLLWYVAAMVRPVQAGLGCAGMQRGGALRDSRKAACLGKSCLHRPCVFRSHCCSTGQPGFQHERKLQQPRVQAHKR